MQSLAVACVAAPSSSNAGTSPVLAQSWKHLTSLPAAPLSLTHPLHTRHTPGRRYQVVYRLVGQVLVIVVADRRGNVFSCLNLARALSQLLVMECKTVDVSPDRLEKRYPQVGFLQRQQQQHRSSWIRHQQRPQQPAAAASTSSNHKQAHPAAAAALLSKAELPEDCCKTQVTILCKSAHV